MKVAVMIARFLLGLVFLVFGVNGFVTFLAVPEFPGDAGAFMGILKGSGYLLVVKALEVIGGVLLLIGRVPAGLLVLGPVVVNILLFHVLLDSAGPSLAVSIVVTLLEGFLIVVHWDRFKQIFE
jgi:uncharacterized membrane protein YphA (DoxX/SURF4 family)